MVASLYDARVLLDSILPAGLLFAAAVGAWHLAARLKAAARRMLRFAAVLLSALAAAAGAGLGDGAALLLLPLAAAALLSATLAVHARPLPDLAATLLLVGALACGLTAALSGWEMLAAVPVVIAALAIIAVALGGLSIMAALSGGALLAGALAFDQQGAHAGVLLFAAAALLGLARQSTLATPSAAPVQPSRTMRRRLAVRS